MRLDDNTTYEINTANNILLNTILLKENYTEEDLVNFYSTNKAENKLIQFQNDKKVILDEKNNIIFIPMYNKFKNFVDYTYTEAENFDLLKTHNIYRKIDKNKKYAASSISQKSMHEIIFGEKIKRENIVDHINSNSLDNRRINLREITKKQNSANRYTVGFEKKL